MREPPIEVLDEIQTRIRAVWSEDGIIPYEQLRRRFPDWKAAVDEAIMAFVTDELEEWPEGDPDFDAVMGEIADHAFLGEEPPTWSRRRSAIDLSRFRRDG